MKTSAEIKDALENVIFDADGGFDPRKDRERYIRYLELVNHEWSREVSALQARLDAIDEHEQNVWLIEHR
jgi:hypothetical protein